MYNITKIQQSSEAQEHGLRAHHRVAFHVVAKTLSKCQLCDRHKNYVVQITFICSPFGHHPGSPTVGTTSRRPLCAHPWISREGVKTKLTKGLATLREHIGNEPWSQPRRTTIGEWPPKPKPVSNRALGAMQMRLFSRPVCPKPDKQTAPAMLRRSNRRGLEEQYASLTLAHFNGVVRQESCS